MATFTNLDQEKLAQSDKSELRKANTLGSDKSVIEEPFANSEIVLREDIFSETPTADTNFASPAYGEWPEGAIASRREKVRLHPLVTSGMTGPSSIQTFVAVSEAPASDSADDIEAVRIKHLVPPDLSIGRTNAADPDPNFRGFELALFPAYSVADASSPTGSRLDGYDGYGPIPITADPSAENGIGSSARWSVDYANGIVRFTGAPLNGISGIMNPFDVYGDIEGNETPDGRITMFATFYQYTGPSLTDSDDVGAVTVGDGTNSFGTYYGPTSTIMQQAVDSLYPYGGTVYLKEGDYTYTETVGVPPNVNVVGLSRRAYVSRPATEPAFSIRGNNAGVSGLTVKTIDSGGSMTVRRSAIEINAPSDSDTIENVHIRNNELWATHDAYGIGFAPSFMNVTFKNIDISGNIFDSPSFEYPIYIGESYDDGTVALENIKITNNDFRLETPSIDGYAILIDGQHVEEMREVHIVDNHIAEMLDIGINPSGAMVEGLYMANNSEFRNVYADDLSASVLENNTFTDVHLDGYVTDSQFRSNIMNAFTLHDTVNDFVFDGNTCFGDVTLKADNASSDREICDVTISNNKLHQNLNISSDLTSMGDHHVKNLVIEGNSITVSINFGDSIAFTGGDLIYTDLRVVGNTIGDSDTTGAPSINFADNASANAYLGGCVFSDNIMHGDAIFYQRVFVGSSSDSVKISDNVFIGSKGVYFYNHELNKITVNGNRLYAVDLFSSPYNYSAPETISRINIKDNIVIDGGAITLHDVTDTSGFTLEQCAIENNIFDNSGSISLMDSLADTNDYTFNDVSVSGNKLPSGNIEIGGALDSDSDFNDMSVKGNYVNGNLSVAGAQATNLHVSDNFVTGDLDLAGELVGEAVVSDNAANYINFQSAVNDATIVGNKILDDSANGIAFGSTLTDSVISNNNIHGTFGITGDCTACELVGNRIIGNVTVDDMTNVNLSGTTITGTFTEAGASGWSSSTFANNYISGAFTATAWDSCGISNSTFADSATFGTLAHTTIMESAFASTFAATTLDQSRIESNTIVGAATMTDMDNESSFSNNTTDSTVAISSTVTRSSVDNNNIASSLTFSDAIENSTINNNTAHHIVFSSTIDDSSVVGNTTESGDTNPAFAAGIITRSVMSGNVLISESAGSAITIGDLVDTRFVGNTIIQSGIRDVDFGTLTDSTVADCDITCSNISTGAMLRSSLDNCGIDGYFSISINSGYMLENSRISNNTVSGAFTLTSTHSDQMIYESKIVDNTINSGCILTAGEIALYRATFDGNVIGGIFTLEVTDNGTNHLGLWKSNLCNNNIASTTTFAGNSNKATFALESVISGNHFGSTLYFGIDTSTGAAGSIMDNSQFTSNYVGGNANFGPSARNQPTYLGSSISENTMAGAFVIYGFAVRCAISDNTVDNDSTFYEMRGCTIDGNNFGADATGSLTFAATAGGDGGLKEGTILSNNIISDTVTLGAGITAAIDSAVIEGNSFVDATTALDIDAPVVNAVINGNHFVGAVDFSASATITESSFSDNHLADSVTFGGDVITSVISNNVADVTNGDITITGNVAGTGSTNSVVIEGNKSKTITISGDIDFATIANNACDLVLSTSSSNKNHVTIANNHLGSISVTNNALAYCTVVGNTITTASSISGLVGCSVGDNDFGAAITLSGAVNDTEIVGNNFGSTLALPATSSSQSTIVGNHFADACTAAAGSYTYTGFNISNNSFDDELKIEGRLLNCVVEGNVVLGAATFDADVSVATLQNTLLNNNTFNSTLTINYDGNSGGTDDAAMVNSILSSNHVAGAVTIGSPDDHAMLGSVLSSNYFGGTVDITNTDSPFTIEDCTIIGNTVVDDFTIDNTLADGYNTCHNSVISGNTLVGSLDIAGTLSSTVSALALSNTVVSGNTIETNLSVANVARSVGQQTCFDSTIANNSVGGTVVLSGLFEFSSFTNNSVTSTCTLDRLLTSRFSDNHITGAFSTGGNTINETVMSDNIFESTFACGAVTSSLISNSVFNNTATTTSLTDSMLSGNTFANTFTGGGGIATSGLVANHFNGAFTITTNTISDSVINSNVFESTFVSSRWEDTTCVGNTFLGAITVTETGTTTKCTNRVTFQGNSCFSTVDFAKSGAGSSDNFLHTTFNGNVFNEDITLGTNGVNNEFTRVAFVGNSGSGGLTIHNGAGTEMDSCMIVANTMNGNLTFANSYPSPPSSGTSDPMIALNWFGAYTNVTFTNDAIGWGSADAANTGNTAGSNRTSAAT